MSSGQVFRWKRLPDARWLGVDGPNWYVVDDSLPTNLIVESNATARSFRSLFRLDENLAQYLIKIKKTAPEFAPYIAQLPGLRVMKPSDVVEETFSFLCTPNNNLSRILPMVRRLAEFGEKLADVEGNAVFRFPDVEAIAAIPEADLRSIGFGYRARTIPNIARQVVDRGGRKWLDGLKRRSYATAHESLMGLDGVGPKLADCICLFALHHTEAVPVDTHLWQAAVRHYFPEWHGKSLTEQRYRAVGDYFRERHGKLAGWAHQYLFYDNLKNWRTYRKG